VSTHLQKINIIIIIIIIIINTYIYISNGGHFTPLTGKGKSKAIPLQALRDPEGSRKLRLPDFKTIGT
jgi:hypothetical protein